MINRGRMDSRKASAENSGRGSKRSGVDKHSVEYKKRRERNNLAVKKSRNKSKQKAKETMDRVTSLQAENANLENKIKLLTKELNFLKDLFLSHAGKPSSYIDLGTILNDDEDEDTTVQEPQSQVVNPHHEKDETDDMGPPLDHEYTLQLNVRVKV